MKKYLRMSSAAVVIGALRFKTNYSTCHLKIYCGPHLDLRQTNLILAHQGSEITTNLLSNATNSGLKAMKFCYSKLSTVRSTVQPKKLIFSFNYNCI